MPFLSWFDFNQTAIAGESPAGRFNRLNMSL